MPIAPARIRAFTITTALGHGSGPHVEALAAMRSALRPGTMEEVSAPCWTGTVEGLDEPALSSTLAAFDCRNNRLATLALEADDFAGRIAAARERFGPTRIGLFLSTSTSGIRHSEHCYRRLFEQAGSDLGEDLRFATTHAYVSLADFCRRRLGLRGPAMVISTACSSGAKTFAAAHRALSAGLCDSAVVGGVDTLCATTLMGFHSLGLLSPTPCAPWSKGRSGVSIGEGAAFALLDLEERRGDDDLALLGYGESVDAHHITAPHPEGAGAVLAMNAALQTAGLAATDIDYVNLHGTGTLANDQSEDQAVTRVFGGAVPVSAIKGLTGHTLGASGAVEAVLSLLCVDAGLLPGTPNTDSVDPGLSAPLVRRSEHKPIDRVLSNAFGFGGNNCALALGRV